MLLPGDALYRLAFPTAPLCAGRAASAGERLFLRLLGGSLLVGWWGLVLAEAGAFRPAPLLLGVIVASALLYLLAWRRGRLRLAFARPPVTWTGLAVAAILLLAGGIFFSHPFETIVGAEDAGIYFNSGGSLARNGGILIHDPGLAEFGDAAASAARQGVARDLLLPPPGNGGSEKRFLFLDWQRLAGFNLLPNQPNTVTPQFLHLFPVWLALWALLGGGIGAMVYGGPAFGLLGVVASYYLARRLFTPAVGVLTALLLTLNGLQVWFARESLSEPLLQFLLLGALYAYVLAVEALAVEDRHTARGAFLLAGLALGSVALAHAQFPFALLPLAPLVAWLWLGRRWRRDYWWFFVPLALLLVHATFHIIRYALGYFEGIYHHVWLDAWRDRGRMAVYLLAPLVLVTLADRFRQRWLPLARDRRWRRRAQWLAVGGVLLSAFYVYVIRPGLLLQGSAALQGYIGAPVAPGAAADVVRLGWYFSPLGIILVAAGLALLLRCDLDERTAALLCFAAPFVALYLTGTYTQEGYIYSLRRYVPVILPAMTILIAYAAVRGGPVVAALLQRPRLVAPLRALGVGAAALLVLFFVYTNAPLIRHREYAGLLDQVAALAARFGPNDIIIFSGARDKTPKIATPLEYLFGRESWVITTNLPRGDRLDAWITEQEAAGRRVHLLMSAGGGKLFLPRHRLVPESQVDFTLTQFEELAQQKPHNVQENHLRYSLYTPVPLQAGQALLGPLPYTIQAGHFDEAVEAPGAPQAQGVYDLERSAGGQPFRWTDGNTLLRVPWSGDGQPLTLRLTLSGGHRPPALGPAVVTVSIKRDAGTTEERQLATLTLTEEFRAYTIAIPADALPPTSDGTAVIRLGLAAKPGQPGASWRPVDWPQDVGGSYDPRWLHVRFARLELTAARP